MPSVGKASRIAADLRAAIARGDYAPGHQLPTRSVLMERYGVAGQTVQNAVEELRREGLVRGVQGGGWFVVEAPLHYPASVSGSSAWRRRTGANTWTLQMTGQGRRGRQEPAVREVPADERIAELLRLPVGKLVLERRRVQYADDEPVQIGTSYYPLDIVVGSSIADPAGVPEGTDAVLEQLGHTPTRYADEIAARLPRDDEIRDLGLADPGLPVLQLTRTTLDQTGRHIEVYQAVMVGHRQVLTYDIDAD